MLIVSEKNITEEQRQIFRKKLDALIELLEKEYQLPELIGSNKQNIWAKDIRIKVVKQLEMARKNISQKHFNWIYRSLLCQFTESSWWIEQSKDKQITKLINEMIKSSDENLTDTDESIAIPQNLLNKNYNCFKSKETSDSNFINSILSNENKSKNVIDTSILINVTKEKIEITCNKDTSLTNLFTNDFDFNEIDSGYIKVISSDDMTADGQIESIAMHLLLKGKKVQLKKQIESSIKSDCDIIFDENNNLCAICRTDSLFTAMKRIGEIKVYLNNSNINEIKELLNHYDINCDEKTKEYLKI